MQSITVQPNRQLFDASAATADECITKVQETMEAFIECGQALAALRDRKLYKEKGYATFEELCRKEFGFSRQHGTRMIAASQYALSLPEEERQKTEGATRRQMSPPKPVVTPEGFAGRPVAMQGTDATPTPMPDQSEPLAAIAADLTIVGAPSHTIQFKEALWGQVAELLGDPLIHIPWIVNRHVKMLARNRAFTQRGEALSKEAQAGRKKK